MTSHPLINHLAVAVLLISAATLGATVQRDISPSQTHCAPRPIASTPNHTNHANHH